jgi:hypothetical protein
MTKSGFSDHSQSIPAGSQSHADVVDIVAVLTLLAALVLSFSKIFWDCVFVALMMAASSSQEGVFDSRATASGWKRVGWT